jgi:hypothetical protein
VRVRAWRDGIHVLVIRNRWWTYRVPLAAVDRVRIGSIGGGQGPSGIVVNAPKDGFSPWHKRRGLPLDGTAAYGDSDRKNAQLMAVRRMVEDARRRSHG